MVQFRTITDRKSIMFRVDIKWECLKFPWNDLCQRRLICQICMKYKGKIA